MSSRTWACFGCRQSVRRGAEYGDAAHEQKVACPECGGNCVYLGHRIPLPPRRDARAWEELQSQLVSEELARRKEAQRDAARRRHQIEREISKLEARPPNAERTKLLHELRRLLGGA